MCSSDLLVEKTQSQWTALTSGMNWQYSQIFQLDFQSLKVGRIRFNIIQGGIPINVYEVTNDNIRNSGYWQRPTLPIFWRVYNDATYSYTEIGYGSENNAIGFRFKVAKNASHTAKAICSTVKSEGGLLVRIEGLPGPVIVKRFGYPAVIRPRYEVGPAAQA